MFGKSGEGPVYAKGVNANGNYDMSPGIAAG